MKPVSSECENVCVCACAGELNLWNSKFESASLKSKPLNDDGYAS